MTSSRPCHRLVLAALLATALAACGRDECAAPLDCPLPAGLCTVPTCEDGQCDAARAEPGSECGEGVVCDDRGGCVPR